MADTKKCKGCDRGLIVVADGERIGHIYPVNARSGRKGYRKSGGCHGGKPAALWDTYANTEEAARDSAIRSLYLLAYEGMPPLV